MKKFNIIFSLQLLTIIIMLFIFKPTFVNGESMAPTLKQDQLLFLDTLNTNPKIGDIVVIDASSFLKNEKYIIKRVIDIKDNKIFVTGDNIGHSLDSWTFGYIDKNTVIGTILFTDIL